MLKNSDEYDISFISVEGTVSNKDLYTSIPNF